MSGCNRGPDRINAGHSSLGEPAYMSIPSCARSQLELAEILITAITFHFNGNALTARQIVVVAIMVTQSQSDAAHEWAIMSE
jgi:hypothetical protein